MKIRSDGRHQLHQMRYRGTKWNALQKKIIYNDSIGNIPSKFPDNIY
jgi:hypothetical protein